MRIILTIIAVVISFQGFSQAHLKVGATGKIQVSENTALVVYGDIVNNGDVTIESGSSLIQKLDGGTANSGPGTYVIKRKGLDTPNGYNMWSSPILSAKLEKSGGVFDGGNPCDMYVFNASTQEWKADFSDGYSTTCAGNPVTFTAANIMVDGNANGVMDVARGYFLPGAASIERSFIGIVNNGNFSTSIWSTTLGDKPNWGGDDWNMVGNPYPSALGLKEFWDLNTASGVITDGVYFWVDDKTGGSGYNEHNSYSVYNSTGSASGSGEAPVINNFAASGQGFWLHAGVTGQVEFKNSMRTSNTNQHFYKRSNDVQRAWLTVRRTNYISNQILIGLTDDATVGYDPKYDARRLHGNTGLEFSFTQDTALYVILGRPTISFDEQDIIPLHVFNDTATMHSFHLDSTQNVNGGNKYYLIDSLVNVIHDLATPYTVQLDTGNHDNRFYLLYKDVINSVADAEAPVLFVKAYQTGDELQLRSNKLDITKVTIYSAVGSQVYTSSKLTNTSVSINVGNLTKGVYLVNYALTNGKSETQKIVIN